MTSDEFLHLKEGDLVRFITDVEICGDRWKSTDVCQVVYNEIKEGGGVVTYYLRNLTAIEEGRRYPTVRQFGAFYFLNYAHKLTTVDKRKHETSFKHQFEINDEIWHMVDNKPKKEIIDGITFIKSERYKKIEIRYSVKESNGYFVEGHGIYGTRDELLDSLRE